MKLIKRSELAANAHHNWFNQYYDNAKNEWRYGEDKKATYNKLVALGAFPSAEDVDKTIGNGSWTRVQCDECGTITEECVQMGEEPSYESSTARICIKCVKKALKLFKENDQ